jgi:hypothetical protein
MKKLKLILIIFTKLAPKMKKKLTAKIIIVKTIKAMINKLKNKWIKKPLQIKIQKRKFRTIKLIYQK